MKVEVTYTRGGRTKVMDERYATVLEKMGLVTRRDLRAEAAPAVEEVPVVPDPVVEPTPKRRYKRRDMQAES